jgi:lipid-A-disaccharide synthase
MKYFIIAGEASGDLHAANLMSEIKRLDPNANFCYLGGNLMNAQGGKLVKHYREMAFMGFWAVFMNLKTILNNVKKAQEEIVSFCPDVVILVDYPGFNLRIAKFVKQHLDITVYYYISPKIWAWKEYRIKQIKMYVDRMFSILPFEIDFYARHQYPIHYVGNPSVDSIARQLNTDQTIEEFCNLNQLSNQPIIALLAGSRKQEIKSCLPKMIQAANDFDGYQIIVSGAPGIDESFYRDVIVNPQIKIVFNQTYQLLHHAQAAVINSGTATLEAGIIGTPQVVVYDIVLGKILFPMRGLLMKIPHFSLVNLVAQKYIVKELIANNFTVENVRRELEHMISDNDYRQKISDSYNEMKLKIGEPGAAVRAAEMMTSFLKSDRKL